MHDIEKVIKGLECCSTIDICCMEISCYYPQYLACPYHEDEECVKHLVQDSLKLLKEQQERINELYTDIDSLKKSCGELYPMVFDVVMCKDCKYWESNDGRYGFCKICHSKNSSNGWFCADGERK